MGLAFSALDLGRDDDGTPTTTLIGEGGNGAHRCVVPRHAANDAVLLALYHELATRFAAVENLKAAFPKGDPFTDASWMSDDDDHLQDEDSESGGGGSFAPSHASSAASRPPPTAMAEGGGTFTAVLGTASGGGKALRLQEAAHRARTRRQQLIEAAVLFDTLFLEPLVCASPVLSSQVLREYLRDGGELGLREPPPPRPATSIATASSRSSQQAHQHDATSRVTWLRWLDVHPTVSLVTTRGETPFAAALAASEAAQSATTARAPGLHWYANASQAEGERRGGLASVPGLAGSRLPAMWSRRYTLSSVLPSATPDAHQLSEPSGCMTALSLRSVMEHIALSMSIAPRLVQGQAPTALRLLGSSHAARFAYSLGQRELDSPTERCLRPRPSFLILSDAGSLVDSASPPSPSRGHMTRGTAGVSVPSGQSHGGSGRGEVLRQSTGQRRPAAAVRVWPHFVLASHVVGDAEAALEALLSVLYAVIDGVLDLPDRLREDDAGGSAVGGGATTAAGGGPVLSGRTSPWTASSSVKPLDRRQRLQTNLHHLLSTRQLQGLVEGERVDRHDELDAAYRHFASMLNLTSSSAAAAASTNATLTTESSGDGKGGRRWSTSPSRHRRSTVMGGSADAVVLDDHPLAAMPPTLPTLHAPSLTNVPASVADERRGAAAYMAQGDALGLTTVDFIPSQPAIGTVISHIKDALQVHGTVHAMSSASPSPHRHGVGNVAGGSPDRTSAFDSQRASPIRRDLAADQHVFSFDVLSTAERDTVDALARELHLEGDSTRRRRNHSSATADGAGSSSASASSSSSTSEGAEHRTATAQGDDRLRAHGSERRELLNGADGGPLMLDGIARVETMDVDGACSDDDDDVAGDGPTAFDRLCHVVHDDHGAAAHYVAARLEKHAVLPSPLQLSSQPGGALTSASSSATKPPVSIPPALSIRKESPVVSVVVAGSPSAGGRNAPRRSHRALNNGHTGGAPAAERRGGNRSSPGHSVQDEGVMSPLDGFFVRRYLQGGSDSAAPIAGPPGQQQRLANRLSTARSTPGFYMVVAQRIIRAAFFAALDEVDTAVLATLSAASSSLAGGASSLTGRDASMPPYALLAHVQALPNTLRDTLTFVQVVAVSAVPMNLLPITTAMGTRGTTMDAASGVASFANDYCLQMTLVVSPPSVGARRSPIVGVTGSSASAPKATSHATVFVVARSGARTAQDAASPSPPSASCVLWFALAVDGMGINADYRQPRLVATPSSGHGTLATLLASMLQTGAEVELGDYRSEAAADAGKEIPLLEQQGREGPLIVGSPPPSSVAAGPSPILLHDAAAGHPPLLPTPEISNAVSSRSAAATRPGERTLTALRTMTSGPHHEAATKAAVAISSAPCQQQDNLADLREQWHRSKMLEDAEVDNELNEARLRLEERRQGMAVLRRRYRHGELTVDGPPLTEDELDRLVATMEGHYAAGLSSAGRSAGRDLVGGTPSASGKPSQQAATSSLVDRLSAPRRIAPRRVMRSFRPDGPRRRQHHSEKNDPPHRSGEISVALSQSPSGIVGRNVSRISVSPLPFASDALVTLRVTSQPSSTTAVWMLVPWVSVADVARSSSDVMADSHARMGMSPSPPPLKVPFPRPASGRHKGDASAISTPPPSRGSAQPGSRRRQEMLPGHWLDAASARFDGRPHDCRHLDDLPTGHPVLRELLGSRRMEGTAPSSRSVPQKGIPGSMSLSAHEMVVDFSGGVDVLKSSTTSSGSGVTPGMEVTMTLTSLTAFLARHPGLCLSHDATAAATEALLQQDAELSFPAQRGCLAEVYVRALAYLSPTGRPGEGGPLGNTAAVIGDGERSSFGHRDTAASSRRSSLQQPSTAFPLISPIGDASRPSPRCLSLHAGSSDAFVRLARISELCALLGGLPRATSATMQLDDDDDPNGVAPVRWNDTAASRRTAKYFGASTANLFATVGSAVAPTAGMSPLACVRKAASLLRNVHPNPPVTSVTSWLRPYHTTEKATVQLHWVETLTASVQAYSLGLLRGVVTSDVRSPLNTSVDVGLSGTGLVGDTTAAVLEEEPPAGGSNNHLATTCISGTHHASIQFALNSLLEVNLCEPHTLRRLLRLNAHEPLMLLASDTMLPLPLKLCALRAVLSLTNDAKIAAAMHVYRFEAALSAELAVRAQRQAKACTLIIPGAATVSLPTGDALQMLILELQVATLVMLISASLASSLAVSAHRLEALGVTLPLGAVPALSTAPSRDRKRPPSANDDPSRSDHSGPSPNETRGEAASPGPPPSAVHPIACNTGFLHHLASWMMSCATLLSVAPPIQVMSLLSVAVDNPAVPEGGPPTQLGINVAAAAFSQAATSKPGIGALSAWQSISEHRVQGAIAALLAARSVMFPRRVVPPSSSAVQLPLSSGTSASAWPGTEGLLIARGGTIDSNNTLSAINAFVAFPALAKAVGRLEGALLQRWVGNTDGEAPDEHHGAAVASSLSGAREGLSAVGDPSMAAPQPQLLASSVASGGHGEDGLVTGLGSSMPLVPAWAFVDQLAIRQALLLATTNTALMLASVFDANTSGCGGLHHDSGPMHSLIDKGFSHISSAVLVLARTGLSNMLSAGQTVDQRQWLLQLDLDCRVEHALLSAKQRRSSRRGSRIDLADTAASVEEPPTVLSRRGSLVIDSSMPLATASGPHHHHHQAVKTMTLNMRRARRVADADLLLATIVALDSAVVLAVDPSRPTEAQGVPLIVARCVLRGECMAQSGRLAATLPPAPPALSLLRLVAGILGPLLRLDNISATPSGWSTTAVVLPPVLVPLDAAGRPHSAEAFDTPLAFVYHTLSLLRHSCFRVWSPANDVGTVDGDETFETAETRTGAETATPGSGGGGSVQEAVAGLLSPFLPMLVKCVALTDFLGDPSHADRFSTPTTVRLSLGVAAHAAYLLQWIASGRTIATDAFVLAMPVLLTTLRRSRHRLLTAALLRMFAAVAQRLPLGLSCAQVVSCDVHGASETASAPGNLSSRHDDRGSSSPIDSITYREMLWHYHAAASSLTGGSTSGPPSRPDRKTPGVNKAANERASPYTAVEDRRAADDARLLSLFETSSPFAYHGRALLAVAPIISMEDVGSASEGVADGGRGGGEEGGGKTSAASRSNDRIAAARRVPQSSSLFSTMCETLLRCDSRLRAHALHVLGVIVSKETPEDRILGPSDAADEDRPRRSNNNSKTRSRTDASALSDVKSNAVAFTLLPSLATILQAVTRPATTTAAPRPPSSTGRPRGEDGCTLLLTHASGLLWQAARVDAVLRQVCAQSGAVTAALVWLDDCWKWISGEVPFQPQRHVAEGANEIDGEEPWSGGWHGVLRCVRHGLGLILSTVGWPPASSPERSAWRLTLTPVIPLLVRCIRTCLTPTIRLPLLGAASVGGAGDEDTQQRRAVSNSAGPAALSEAKPAVGRSAGGVAVNPPPGGVVVATSTSDYRVALGMLKGLLWICDTDGGHGGPTRPPSRTTTGGIASKAAAAAILEAGIAAHVVRLLGHPRDAETRQLAKGAMLALRGIVNGTA